MASIHRLARTLVGCRRSLAPSKTLTSLNRPSPRFHGVYSPSPRFQYLLGGRTFQHHRYSEESEQFPPRWISQLCLPVMLSALLGVGVIDVTYADTDEISAKTPLPAQSSPTLSHSELVEIAMKERVRVEKLCKSKGTQYGFYPRFSVAVKDQKVTIKFQIPPTCEIPLIIADLVSRLGSKIDDDASGSNMMLQAWNSGVAWQLTLGHHGKQDRNGETLEQGKDIDTKNSDLCILLSRPLVGSNNAEIEFMKPGSLNSEELEALVSVMQIVGQQKTSEGKLRGDIAQTHDKTVASLQDMGVKIFGLNENKLDDEESDISWENIAGYDQQKREIEDTILLALRSPEVYDEIARETRSKFETNRPRAVLFEGPPGTGKTSCARVIANQAGVPLLYVPLEIIVSKYYGQSERLLGKVFSLANELPNGAIIFLDEVDSFVASRDGEIHEATRRLLSVILRQIDGFEQEKKVVVVAATNRKQDLDPALLSRFDSMIIFGLPDHQTRQEIAAQYAKHLTKTELIEFANATEHMSGRDIKDVCQQAERHWAAKIIRGKSNGKEEHQELAPPLQEYIESAMYRQQSLIDAAANEWQPFAPRRKRQFDFL